MNPVPKLIKSKYIWNALTRSLAFFSLFFSSPWTSEAPVLWQHQLLLFLQPRHQDQCHPWHLNENKEDLSVTPEQNNQVYSPTEFFCVALWGFFLLLFLNHFSFFFALATHRWKSCGKFCHDNLSTLLHLLQSSLWVTFKLERAKIKHFTWVRKEN